MLVFFRQLGRGKTSGLEIAQTHARAANVFEIDAGKVTRLVLYFGRERAHAELGLPSEASWGWAAGHLGRARSDVPREVPNG